MFDSFLWRIYSLCRREQRLRDGGTELNPAWSESKSSISHTTLMLIFSYLNPTSIVTVIGQLLPQSCCRTNNPHTQVENSSHLFSLTCRAAVVVLLQNPPEVVSSSFIDEKCIGCLLLPRCSSGNSSE